MTVGQNNQTIIKPEQRLVEEVEQLMQHSEADNLQRHADARPLWQLVAPAHQA